LGKYTIGANGVVLLGPPTVFNAQNIDQFNF
jgi:rhamnose transport system substrate-binding protein